MKNISLISFEIITIQLLNFTMNIQCFLPSYTEGHPQVLDGALARQRPVIIFEDIAHVIRNEKGIFISKRNIKSLEETIELIISNYSNIKEELRQMFYQKKILLMN